ncbi:MAG: hypothetical protein ACOYN5_05440 [Bacteroidales bacterium]|jgi:hypothetical protein
MKKNLRLILGILLLASVSFGCKKLLDVEFDADFKADMPVSIAADAEPDSVSTAKNTNQDWYYFGVSKTIDPNDNADYNKYADKIKDITVSTITAKITNLSKPLSVLLYFDVFDVSNGTSVTFIFPMTPVFEGKTFTFIDEDGKFDAIKAMFKDGHKVETSCTGYTTERGVTFKVETIYGTKMVANPLN